MLLKCGTGGALLAMAELRALPAGPDGVRRELVARVRELIAAGEYDTPDRWHQAQERMFNELLDG